VGGAPWAAPLLRVALRKQAFRVAPPELHRLKSAPRMLFNSIGFLVFFPLVTTIYYLLPYRLRWMWLLGASCYFYMSFIPIYICILLLTILVDYFAAIRIHASNQESDKQFYLRLSVVSTLLILFVFKYFNFVNDNVAALARALRWNYPVAALSLALPIGLSFHTFQSLSYVIEVYRGNQVPERHFGLYCLYVMFYPQLVAGPIERPQNLLHQLREPHPFDAGRAIYGLNRMGLGLVKKMVIADRLAVYVNQVYRDPSAFTLIPVAIAIIFFAIQVYCDFSGYSDIAIGCAEVMGIELMENFDRPYLSRSVTEFWRRWHMSLSTWFNDYVFSPLFTSVRDWGKGGLAFSLFITFLLAGVWHGAGWTFVIYGMLHGLAMIYEALTKKQRKVVSRLVGDRVYGQLARVTTLTFISLAYVFFRSADLAQARVVFAALARHEVSFNLTQICAGSGPFSLALSCAVIGLLGLIYQLPADLRLSRGYALAFACAASATIVLFGKDSASAFIYFQF
jgi:D-alanyl-lipoteichoic acid acyltransferase DltB (MBOAT superfamily)